MTRKADFNAEEFAVVVDGPLYAGVRVIAAERGGTLRESLAMNQVYADARAAIVQGEGAGELLDAIVATPPTIDAVAIQRAGGDVGEVTRTHLRRAVEILERLATQAELDAYKTFVMTVAQAVATAHREGGFLGIGGRAVSEREEAALDEISAALGTPPAGASVSDGA